MNNKNFKNLQQKKIIDRGSQGKVILASNNKYVVKIYDKKAKNLIMLLYIIRYFINCKNLPKTIYNPYYITEKFNSLNRYISNNNLPKYFTYRSENELENLKKIYNVKPRLFEVMKKYSITLTDFIKKLKNNNINDENKIKILHSLFVQGILTLLWLYMKKGIVHLDINSDNFFVEKTDDSTIDININNIKFNVKLYGYYLVIADFGYAKSIEFFKYDNFEYNIRNCIETLSIHPWNDLNDFIRLFKSFFYNYEIENINFNINYINSKRNNTSQYYKNMLRSYYKNKDDLKENIKIFKNSYFEFVKKYILLNEQ